MGELNVSRVIRERAQLQIDTQAECSSAHAGRVIALDAHKAWDRTVEAMGLWTDTKTLRAVMLKGPTGSSEHKFLQRYLAARENNRSGSEALAELERLLNAMLVDS